MIQVPGDFANTRLSGNKVNSAALMKMSMALATWRAAVKRMIEKGDSYEKIKEKNPSITEDDYNDFKINCSRPQTPNQVSGGKKCGS